MHAFNSRKVGLRAKHLALHEVLCMLMGWNSTAAEHNRSWVCRPLPDVEARAQREDLIIWPPVVIIHNSSIGKRGIDERMILTDEQLHNILKGTSRD